VIEWRKAFETHEKLGKKTILFVMTDDTKNCDDVAAYLEGTCPELKGKVLVIHTNKSGEISEAASGKSAEELKKLREEANTIDGWESPYKAVVSVMMLKEGWDVRNVTTIVGLRAYAAPSDILPEQTLGRGLRKMYLGGVEEYVSVVGTDAFMDFVERITAEGVTLERTPMGEGSKPKSPLVEVDKQNEDKERQRIHVVEGLPAQSEELAGTEGVRHIQHKNEAIPSGGLRQNGSHLFPCQNLLTLRLKILGNLKRPGRSFDQELLLDCFVED
jgi:type III restriction enzyme